MYRWVRASGGVIPNGAAAHDHEANGESLFVCRANSIEDFIRAKSEASSERLISVWRK